MDDDAIYDVRQYLTALQVTAHGTMVDLDMLLRKPTYSEFRSVGNLISVLDEYFYLTNSNYIDPDSRDVLANALLRRSIDHHENRDLAHKLRETMMRFKKFEHANIGNLIDTCIDFQTHANKKLKLLEKRRLYLSPN